MKKHILILVWLTITCSTFAQKSKKIFSSLQEGNLIEAKLQYDKISSDKKYNEKEIVLFNLANSLMMIESSSNSYKPIESIINFNNIFIPSEEKADIEKFLSKYGLSMEIISDRIHSEIVIQAKKLNTIESFANALQVCADKDRIELLELQEEAVYRMTVLDKSIIAYKAFIIRYPKSYHRDEIQSLLERTVLDLAKKSQVIEELNSFIQEYSTSKLSQEATDYRDSILLLKVPNNYDSMLAFTIGYPNSKFNDNINLMLPKLLFEEIVKSNFEYEKCAKFISEYPYDKRVNIIDSVFFNKVLSIDSITSYNEYLKLMKNGINYNVVLKKIDDKTISLEKIINCYNLDTLNLFLKCENILDFSGIYLFQICLTKSINKLKENVILKNVQNKYLTEKLFIFNYDLIENDIESKKIIIELLKIQNLFIFLESNIFKDSIKNIDQLWFNFSPYLDDLGFDLEIIGNGFITLTTNFGTGSSINSTLYLVKNNYLFDIDISNFKYELNKYLLEKYPNKNCYAEISHTTYKLNKSKNELILTGGLICNEDARCCPSFQYKVISTVLNNKILIKSISSSKTIH